MLLALGLVAVSASGCVGLDRLPVLAQVTAFRAQWALVGAAAALVLVRWLRAAVLPLLLVVVGSAVLLAPRVVAGQAPGGAAELRVYTANVRYDTADPVALARSIAEQGADVVALPEASRRYADDLASRLPGYVVGGGSAVSFSSVSTSLLVRSSLEPQLVDGPVGMANSTAAVVVQVGGRSVRVEAVHPSSPVPGDEPSWTADLARLQPSCRASTPTVVLGDLNATLDHSGLRDVLAAGCVDAAESTGDALTGTWPQRAPRWLGAQIDHVLLAGGVRAKQVRVLDDPGSDHRAVAAVLVVP